MPEIITVSYVSLTASKWSQTNLNKEQSRRITVDASESGRKLYYITYLVKKLVT